MKNQDYEQNEGLNPASAYKFPEAYCESRKTSVDSYTLETGILTRLHEISMILCLTFAPMKYCAPSPNPHFCARYSIRD